MLIKDNNQCTYVCNTHVLHGKSQCALKGINKFNICYIIRK